CSQSTDPLKLAREGTGQDERSPTALDPAFAPLDERGPAHSMVFAQSYSALLKYFDQNNNEMGDWSPFFGGDVSVQLAVPAIENLDAYKTNVQAWFAYLNELENHAKEKEDELKTRFSYLYASVASLGRQ